METKSIAQRLLIKPGQRVALAHSPAGFAQSLSTLPEGAAIVSATASKPNVVLLFVKNKTQLEAELVAHKANLADAGALWVCYYKGTSATATDINRDLIAAYAATHGLAPFRIISIDADWSALAFKVVG